MTNSRNTAKLTLRLMDSGDSREDHEVPEETVSGSPTDESESEFCRVMQKLARAWQYSQDCDRSPWDFAVELTDLSQDGVTHETLRWMIGKGLVEHALESENRQGIGRTFESRGGFTFNNRSCFVITHTGLKWQLDQAPRRPLGFDQVAPAAATPVWDDQRHELRLGGTLVKRFKWRAANQEAVLAAFQEEGWPPRIDDPLSPVPDTDPKRRLSDAIKCLNRKQANSLLRFSGDGTGEGILWEVVTVEDPVPEPVNGTSCAAPETVTVDQRPHQPR